MVTSLALSLVQPREASLLDDIAQTAPAEADAAPADSATPESP